MVTLGVLAILALATVPGTLDRLVREQVTEALPLADLAKPAIAAAWLAGAPLPVDNTAAGLPPPEKIVSQRVQSVTVDHGAIHIRFGNRAQKALQGHVLTVRPAGVPDARIVPLAWLCGGATTPSPMVAQGENRTSVAQRLLPAACR
jgi:type IV pilus assembly protein PilA